jgi:hypothetical protein
MILCPHCWGNDLENKDVLAEAWIQRDHIDQHQQLPLGSLSTSISVRPARRLPQHSDGLMRLSSAILPV